MLPDHVEGNARATYLDKLYFFDGRHYPKHPLHGVYTGLYQERLKVLAQQDREALEHVTIIASEGDVD